MKFCILCAGKGTRNTYYEGLHKALLPLENRATISHILDKVDKSIEIILALGYNAEQVKSYVSSVHNDRKFSYVYVDNFDQKGSGPGYSLLCCKEKLQEPFIFTSVDTIIGNDECFKTLNENWLGVANVDSKESHQYCLVDGDVYLKKLYYGTGNKAYIGMAGIYDYEDFWKSLEEKKIIKNEYQVIHGFDGLNKIKLFTYDWYDTGNNIAYALAKNVFCADIVATKNNEVIYIDNGKVIKYFTDTKKIDNLIGRIQFLNNTCPNVTKINDNMFKYDYINGEILSNIYDETIFDKFLNFCKDNLFVISERTESFIDNCKNMYEEKTKSRLKPLFGSDLDKITNINGISIEPVEVLLNKIDWKFIYDISIPSSFHGDLQPENVIYSYERDKFTLIDWREKFGNDEKIGDIYYDLSKLYHALLINGNVILNKDYDYIIEKESANVMFHIKNNLLIFMDMFKDFCIVEGYNWKNIELLGILHYLNICNLYSNFHSGKYGNFLFLYGKYLLTKYLR